MAIEQAGITFESLYHIRFGEYRGIRRKSWPKTTKWSPDSASDLNLGIRFLVPLYLPAPRLHDCTNFNQILPHTTYRTRERPRA